MKKNLILAAAILMATSPLAAQQVTENDFTHLSVSYETPSLGVSESQSPRYTILDIEGYTLGGETGTPALPQLGSIIEVPVCSGFRVSVTNAVYDTLQLSLPVLPMQPSRSKSDTARHPLVIDRQLYSTDALLGELASVEYLGIARDRHIARLAFSPVRVNPVTGIAVVCRKADVTVEYLDADREATDALYLRHHTPAYSIGATLNSLPRPKSVSAATPVRLAILAHSAQHCRKLDNFILWKRQQGFRVDTYYIDELGILSASAIDAMLKELYTNATDDDPAPAYLIIIGDIAQVPSHSSKLTSSGWYGPSNDHITDLYYTTWTSGDKVPDCYFGRLSATDTATLGDIIDKTLLYEKYLFADDSYLARAALIAGVDQGYSTDNAYTYADPAMDYIAKYYINAANGYDTIVYYKNLTSFAPDGVTVTGGNSTTATATALKNYYNEGAGWINYSAHGDWDCWYKPSFTVSDVANMTNNGRPAFMIGNCCLTNKFNKGACLGEALLRKGDTAGAIGYIGGSNSTYWAEDFYWEVGVRNNISGTMNATYDASNLGVYDRLFHTHGEAQTATAPTAGKMLMFGNVAVQSTSSSLRDYYWEIYHLMGDPTLMPWLGRAEEPYVTVVRCNGTTLQVQTLAGAYVAVVDQTDSMRVIAAAFAGTDGLANLTIPSSHAGLMLSVNAQGHKPFGKTLTTLAVDDIAASATPLSVYPNPSTGTTTIELGEPMPVSIIDMQGRTVATSEATTTFRVSGLRPGVYLVRTPSSATRLVIIGN